MSTSSKERPDQLPHAVRAMRRAALLVLALLVLVTALFSWQTWKDARAELERDMDSAGELGTHAINTLFMRYQTALEFLAMDLFDKSGRLIDPVRVHAQLVRFKDINKSLSTVGIARPDGQLLISTDAAPGARLPSIGDLPSFKDSLAEFAAGRTFSIGRPLVAPVNGEWVIPLRLAVRGSSAGVGHVLFTTMPLARPQAMWRDAPIVASAALGLIRDDGYLLTRHPVPASVQMDSIYGTPRTGTLIQHLRDNRFPKTGIIDGLSSLEGPGFIYAYQRLDDYSATFFVAMPRAELRRLWWERIRVAYFLIGVLALGGFWIYRAAEKQQLTQDTERQRSAQQIAAAHARLDGIISSATDAVISIDKDQRIVLFNGAAERMFGYPRERILGQPLERLIPEDHRSGHAGRVHHYGATGQTNRRMGSMSSVSGVRASGEHFPIEASISHMQVGGQPMYTAIVRDISERRRLESALVAARNEAERANRTKSEYLSSMSHELRTPLNAILGFAQLLQAGVDDKLTPRQTAHVGHMRDAGMHLQRLIEDVLDLAKIEADQVSLSIEPLAVDSLIRECMTIVRPSMDGRAINLVNNASVRSDSMRVLGDRVRLTQVLINLLTNAVKYNRDGGSVTIDVSPVDGEHRTRISVTDTGIGMNSDQIANLYKPFHRLGQEGGATKGTGLGLVISKRLAMLMNGDISVRSEPGRGSTFSIELPRASDRGLPSHAGSANASAMGIRRYGARTVLYVEDNPANVELMKSVFALRPDLTLVHADNALLGLDLARARHPDLMILDINLPGHSGFDLLEMLKNTRETRAIPCIALSANAMPTDIKSGIAAGFLAYLTKPLIVPIFLDQLDRLLTAERPYT